ncbi:MAG: hypothetical protein HYT73_01725 [Candidatus Aenigmarchaeota archaeon]|nr:hypothetical protein [Candidatus Aenigmarchaeota archaeon]
MAEIRELFLGIFVAVLVISIMILIFTRGNESALTLGDRVEKAFDKNKFIADVSGACYTIDSSRLNLTGVIPEYREYLAEGDSVSIMLTAAVDGKAGFSQELNNPDFVLDNNELQLSSISTIGCVSDGKQCDFQQTEINFNIDRSEVINLQDSGGNAVPKSIKEILDSQQSVQIGAWKEVGLDADRVYPVTFEDMIEQRTNFYLGSFILNKKC